MNTETIPNPLRGVEQIAAPYLGSSSNFGLGIGIYHDGLMSAFGLGRLQAGKPESPDEHTLFEIGSITAAERLPRQCEKSASVQRLSPLAINGRPPMGAATR